MQRGFEADASFYFRNEPLVRDREQIDAEVDPAPDLVIEIDVSHPSLDKLSLYASMGVPEVWRCVGDRVAILVLETGAYRASDRSLALPVLSPGVLSRFMVEARTARWVEWIRTVRAWAREQRAGDAMI